MKKRIVGVFLLLLVLFTASCGEKKEKTNNATNYFKKDRTESDEDFYNINEDVINEVKEGINLDPFENIKVNFMGLSPFVTVNIDMSMCSDEEQRILQFTYDDILYKLGDSVLISVAINSDATDDKPYTLLENSKAYVVENTGEWLTNIEGIDLSLLDSEIEDKLLSETTQTPGAWDFGGKNLSSVIVSISEPEFKNSYFVTLKPNQYDNFDYKSEYSEFNYYICLFNYELEMDGTNDIHHATVSAAVVIKNIKLDKDGNMTWNTSLEYHSSLNNYEQLLNDIVVSKRERYNVSELK